MKRKQKQTFKKHGTEYIKMSFGDEYYFND